MFRLAAICSGPAGLLDPWAALATRDSSCCLGLLHDMPELLSMDTVRLPGSEIRSRLAKKHWIGCSSQCSIKYRCHQELCITAQVSLPSLLVTRGRRHSSAATAACSGSCSADAVNFKLLVRSRLGLQAHSCRGCSVSCCKIVWSACIFFWEGVAHALSDNYQL